MDPGLPHSFEHFIPVYETGNFLAGSLADQNSRYIEAASLFEDDSEIQSLVLEGIAEEQTTTMSKLRDFTAENAAAYSDLGTHNVALFNEIDRTSEEIRDAETSIETDQETIEEFKRDIEVNLQDKVQHILKEVERLSPAAVDKVDELLRQRVATSSEFNTVAELEASLLELKQNVELLHGKRASFTEQYRATGDIISTYLQAWPLPFTLLKKAGVEVPKIVEIDDLPVDPTILDRDKERLAEIKRHTIDQPEVMLYCIKYFSENPGITITVDELIQYLYPAEVIARQDDYHLRSRITTRLGPETGSVIREILQSEGYIFQFGWRKYLQRSEGGHVKVLTRKRIYRAVPINELESISDHTETETEADDFETPVRTVVLQCLSSTAESNIHNLDLQTIEPPASVHSLANEEHGSRGWENILRTQAIKALGELGELGLLDDPAGQKLGLFREMHEGQRTGTLRSLEKLAGANLISRDFEKYRDRLPDFIVSPEIMIYLRLFGDVESLSTLFSSAYKVRGTIRRVVEKFYEISLNTGPAANSNYAENDVQEYDK